MHLKRWTNVTSSPVLSYLPAGQVAAVLLYCLEVEAEGATSHCEDGTPLSSSSSPSSSAAANDLEAQTYTLFCRFMDDIELLYDPTPLPSVTGNHPAVVPYLIGKPFYSPYMGLI